MNKAMLMGRLTKDPELRQTSSNIPYCFFTVAVDRRFKNQDGVRETDFIPIVAWRHNAEFANKYFRKGSRIIVIGSIQPSSYDDKDGVRRYRTDVVADEFYFADSKKGDSNESYGDRGGYEARKPKAASKEAVLSYTREEESELNSFLPFDPTDLD